MIKQISMTNDRIPKIKTMKVLQKLIILLPAIIIFWFVGSLQVASATAMIPTPESLCGAGGFPCPTGTNGIDMLQNTVSQLGLNVRTIIGAVAVLTIIISGVKLLTSQGNEEVFTKESQSLVFGVIGLFVIALAGDVAQIFDVQGSGFLGDPNVAVQKARLFNRSLQIGITFIKYIIGAVSVIFIVRNGLRLVLFGGNEDDVTKDKKNIFYGLLGLVVIFMSDPIINQVFFKIDTSKFPGIEPTQPKLDAVRLAQEIAGVTNIIAALAGPFALLSLVAGAIMYILAAGDDEKIGKAKKIITWALVGLILIYGAFAIVSTFITRQFNGI